MCSFNWIWRGVFNKRWVGNSTSSLGSWYIPKCHSFNSLSLFRLLQRLCKKPSSSKGSLDVAGGAPSLFPSLIDIKQYIVDIYCCNKIFSFFIASFYRMAFLPLVYTKKSMEQWKRFSLILAFYFYPIFQGQTSSFFILFSQILRVLIVCSYSQILWTAMSLAMGLEIRGDIIRGLPCIKRLNQLFCPTAGNRYPG